MKKKILALVMAAAMTLGLTACGGGVRDTEYGADIVLTVLVPEEQSDAYAARILDFTAGTVETLVDGEVFQPVPVRPGTQK